jgi:hypothetical protein
MKNDNVAHQQHATGTRNCTLKTAPENPIAKMLTFDKVIFSRTLYNTRDVSIFRNLFYAAVSVHKVCCGRKVQYWAYWVMEVWLAPPRSRACDSNNGQAGLENHWHCSALYAALHARVTLTEQTLMQPSKQKLRYEIHQNLRINTGIAAPTVPWPLILYS